jgi:hypothetical protein
MFFLKTTGQFRVSDETTPSGDGYSEDLFVPEQ